MTRKTGKAELHLSPSAHHRHLMAGTIRSLRYDGGEVAGWKRRLRRKLRQLVGEMPKERTPLRPRRLWNREHKLGTVEKVVFTSEPYCDVPAYVCLPRDADLTPS